MFIKLENLGTVNKNKVQIGGLTIYFSYETPVGFQYGNNGLIVRENDWSTTTGKLLNELEPDKTRRVSGQVFEDSLAFYSKLAIADMAKELQNA